MASIVKYPLDPLDTSLLSQSGSHSKFRASKSKAAVDPGFSFCLQAVIDRLDKAQNAALKSAGNFVGNTSTVNIDSLLGQLNTVNGSLKDILSIRSEIIQAYQSNNSLASQV
jgi:flagellar hook-basal body complex protein FliE